MSCGEELELVVAHVEEANSQQLHFGVDVCHHTSIQHGDHQGWLINGKLLCKRGQADALVECRLDWETDVGCQIVQLLDGHVHGSGCGHEQIPHGDHFDYLVDGRLHHVVSEPSCCKQECLGFLSEASVVDHGSVNVVKHRNVHAIHKPDEFCDDEKEIVTSIYASGICCPSELPIINKVLEHINGVISIDVAVMTKTIKVTHVPSKVSPAVLVSALNDAGLQASLGSRGQASGTAPKRPPWTVVGSGLLLLISLLSLCDDNLEALKYVGIGATVIGSPFIVMRAWAALRRFILDINVLMIIAVAGAIGLGEYYESAAIVFLFGLAEWLEDRCMGRARNAVGMLAELQPEFAIDAATGTTIPVEEVMVDRMIIVRPGDRVPVDCVIVSGNSAVDESMLTGESRPVPKQSGSKLKSGTINSGKGSLKARATATVQSSTIAQVALLVDEASMQKSKTEKFIEKFAKIYTPAVVLGAAVLAIIPPAMGKDPKEWVYLSLLLLVTACPCALVISTPVVTVCGITQAAKKSILIKGGQYLEELAGVKAITFDKTGTLTEGRFAVTSVACSSNSTEEEVLSLAGAIEVHSTHPLGPAIAGYASARNFTDWGEVHGMKIVPGQGIIGFIGGKRIGCGNVALMKDLCPESPLPSIPDNGFSSVCYVSKEADVIGCIYVTDTVRPEAKETIEQLKKMGIVSTMLTGDQLTNADMIAESVGIESSHVHAQLLPRDKLDTVQYYREQFGTTAHIGDGINDAPALACADVGIAMGIGGSALAVEAADIALFSNNLKNLPEAIKISQHVRSKLIQNVTFAILVKVVVLIFAFTGKVALWLAVLADVGSSLLVVLNGLMILGWSKRNNDQGSGDECVAAKLAKKNLSLSEIECKAQYAALENPCSSTHHVAMAQETLVKKPCCSSKHGCTATQQPKKKSCCSSKLGCKEAQRPKKKSCCSSKHGCTSMQNPEEVSCCPSKHGCILQITSEKQAHSPRNHPASTPVEMKQAEPKCCGHKSAELGTLMPDACREDPVKTGLNSPEQAGTSIVSTQERTPAGKLCGSGIDKAPSCTKGCCGSVSMSEDSSHGPKHHSSSAHHCCSEYAP